MTVWEESAVYIPGDYRSWNFHEDDAAWSTFAMLWLFVPHIPSCCADHEYAERQSVAWAERALVVR